MTRTTTLSIFYCAVASICLAIVGISLYLRSRIPQPDVAAIVGVGKQSEEKWYPISEDLVATNQEGREVRLSDLKGKVWLVAEFFAICPHCAVRNGEELHKLHDAFGDHPDFHIVCISVDPQNDNVARLKEYATALNADASDWWFLNAGDTAATHRYLEQVLKFFSVRERTDPADVQANGRYAHDLGFFLVDRELRVVGKWPLADARSPEARKLDPDLYERLRDDLFSRIRRELDAKPAAPTP